MWTSSRSHPSIWTALSNDFCNEGVYLLYFHSCDVTLPLSLLPRTTYTTRILRTHTVTLLKGAQITLILQDTCIIQTIMQLAVGCDPSRTGQTYGKEATCCSRPASLQPLPLSKQIITSLPIDTTFSPLVEQCGATHLCIRDCPIVARPTQCTAAPATCSPQSRRKRDRSRSHSAWNVVEATSMATNNDNGHAPFTSVEEE